MKKKHLFILNGYDGANFLVATFEYQDAELCANHLLFIEGIQFHAEAAKCVEIADIIIRDGYYVDSELGVTYLFTESPLNDVKVNREDVETITLY